MADNAAPANLALEEEEQRKKDERAKSQAPKEFSLMGFIQALISGGPEGMKAYLDQHESHGENLSSLSKSESFQKFDGYMHNKAQVQQDASQALQAMAHDPVLGRDPAIVRLAELSSIDAAHRTPEQKEEIKAALHEMMNHPEKVQAMGKFMAEHPDLNFIKNSGIVQMAGEISARAHPQVADAPHVAAHHEYHQAQGMSAEKMRAMEAQGAARDEQKRAEYKYKEEHGLSIGSGVTSGNVKGMTAEEVKAFEHKMEERGKERLAAGNDPEALAKLGEKWDKENARTREAYAAGEIGGATTIPGAMAKAGGVVEHKGHFKDEQGQEHGATFTQGNDQKWRATGDEGKLSLAGKNISVTMDKGDAAAGATYQVAVAKDSSLGNVQLSSTPQGNTNQQLAQR